MHGIWLFRTPLLALFLARAARGLPLALSSRSGINVAILAGTRTPQFPACSDKEIAFTNSFVGEMLEQAKAASAALKTKNIAQSPAFTDYLTGNPAEIDAIHYQPIIANMPPVIPHTNTISFAENAVTYICPETCNKPKTDFFAFAVNDGGNDPTTTPRTKVQGNRVFLCPLFFGIGDTNSGESPAPRSISVAAKDYLKGKRLGNCPSMTLLHEFQHLKAFVGAANVHVDRKVVALDKDRQPLIGSDGKPKLQQAYKADDCKRVAESERPKNAQNFAWFAFDAVTVPARVQPCAQGSVTARGLGTSSTPSKIVPALSQGPAVVAPKRPVSAGTAVAKAPAPPVAAKSAPGLGVKLPGTSSTPSKIVPALPKGPTVVAPKRPVSAGPTVAKTPTPVAAKSAPGLGVKGGKPPVVASTPAHAACPAANLKLGDITFDFVDFVD